MPRRSFASYTDARPAKRTVAKVNAITAPEQSEVQPKDGEQKHKPYIRACAFTWGECMEDKTYRFLFGLPRSKETRITHVVALTISLMTLCANILLFIYAFEYNLYLAYGILIGVCLIGIIMSFREMYVDWKLDDYNLISSLSFLKFHKIPCVVVFEIT